MIQKTDIVCIGSILWDVIGRTTNHLYIGSDVPGRITRLPGGVAMNIAMTLRQYGMRPALLSTIGRDPEGNELIEEAQRMGLICDYIYRSNDLPTDVYMAIEGSNGLIAAIADAHSLETTGDKILTAMGDGRLGTTDCPFTGLVALDGNLTEKLLQIIVKSPLFRCADLRVAPASPGKAARLSALMGHPTATLYVNLEEAGLLCQTKFATSNDGAVGLLKRGAHRVLVTDKGNAVSEGTAEDIICHTPPSVVVARVTGAGDTFMATHIASEAQGMTRIVALTRAANAAATYVSGKTPL